jgi:SAM-dependent methyltransferase
MECAYCHAHPRHRLIYIYLKERTNFWDDQNVKFLNVAPDICYVKQFAEYFPNYLMADLNMPGVVKMDIMDIQYPDETFDIIFCNDVLEHVPEDRKAMSELYRVLKKGGWAILDVPNKPNCVTYEDFSITTPEGRLKAFGQHDHVRMYGREDYVDRLSSAGFKVQMTEACELLKPKQLTKMGIKEANIIFQCFK